MRLALDVATFGRFRLYRNSMPAVHRHGWMSPWSR